MSNNAPLEQIIAKAWSDPDFKQQLIDQPEETLKSQGASLPENKQIRVAANDAQTLHLVIPARPTDLSDEQLDAASGGVEWRFCAGGCFSDGMF